KKVRIIIDINLNIKKKFKDKLFPQNNPTYSFQDLKDKFDEYETKDFIERRLDGGMKVLILLGAPGAGKGVYSRVLKREFNLFPINIGEILREEIRKNTDLGKKIATYVEKGDLVPDEIVIKMIEIYLSSLPENIQGIVFDGFPRTLFQAQVLDKILEERNIELKGVFYLMIEEAVAIERIRKRKERYGRKDDNVDILNRRFQLYKRQIEPLREYYSQKGLLYTINADVPKNAILDSIVGIMAELGFEDVGLKKILLTILGGDVTTQYKLSKPIKENNVWKYKFVTLNNAFLEEGYIVVSENKVEVYDKEGNFVNYLLRESESCVRNYVSLGEGYIEEAKRRENLREKKELITKAYVSFQNAFNIRPNDKKLVDKIQKLLKSSDKEEKIVSALFLVDNIFASRELRIECIKILKEYEEFIVRTNSLKNRIDLHCHTFYSDGVHSPSKLVFEAWRHEMKMIGIVDHNTVDAFKEALVSGRILGIDVIVGIEFDLYDEEIGLDNFHLIGYFYCDKWEDIEEVTKKIKFYFDKYSIKEKLDDLILRYKNRVNGYVELFNKKYKSKLELTENDLLGYLTYLPNRYQLGKALFDKYGSEILKVTDFRSATNKYFPKGMVELKGKDGINIKDVISYLRKTGATIILPHPGEKMSGKRMFEEKQLEILLRKYAEYIDGLEVYSSKHTQEEAENYINLIQRLNSEVPYYKENPLVITIGSDAHEERGILLGKGDVRKDIKGNLPEVKIISSELLKFKIRMEKNKYRSYSEEFYENLWKKSIKVRTLNLETIKKKKESIDKPFVSIVIGAPFSNQILKDIDKVRQELSKIIPPQKIIFNPQKLLHITVLGIQREDISEEEVRIIKNIIERVGPFYITIQGINITPNSGTIIAQGILESSHLIRIRECIRKKIPYFSENVSISAHVTLGRLIEFVERNTLEKLQNFVKENRNKYFGKIYVKKMKIVKMSSGFHLTNWKEKAIIELGSLFEDKDGDNYYYNYEIKEKRKVREYNENKLNKARSHEKRGKDGGRFFYLSSASEKFQKIVSGQLARKSLPYISLVHSESFIGDAFYLRELYRFDGGKYSSADKKDDDNYSKLLIIFEENKELLERYIEKCRKIFGYTRDEIIKGPFHKDSK
ncbi:MAG: adenylate kinase, partial [Candidatus Omnitrophota bacterium]